MGRILATSGLLVSAMLLAACDRAPEAGEDAAGTAETGGAVPVEPDSETGDGTAPPETPSGGETTAAPGAEAEAIPVALRGRWGLTANDCDPTRADNKGLLTISADSLEFYESVGRLDSIEEADPTRISAGFDFTGEGMSWERDVVLDVQDGGETLIRREYGEDAAPGPFRYSKCA